MLFPPLNKRNTRDKVKGVRIPSERHIGELGVRYLSTLNREDRVLRKVAFSGRVGSIKEKPHGLPMRGKPWGLCVRDLAAVA